MNIVTIAILVLVVWCAAAVLIGLALGAFFRAASHDDTPTDRLTDDLPDEPAVHDDALTRDEARFTDDTLDEPAVGVDPDVPHAVETRRPRR